MRWQPAIRLSLPRIRYKFTKKLSRATCVSRLISAWTWRTCSRICSRLTWPNVWATWRTASPTWSNTSGSATSNGCRFMSAASRRPTCPRRNMSCTTRSPSIYRQAKNMQRSLPIFKIKNKNSNSFRLQIPKRVNEPRAHTHTHTHIHTLVVVGVVVVVERNLIRNLHKWKKKKKIIFINTKFVICYLYLIKFEKKNTFFYRISRVVYNKVLIIYLIEFFSSSSSFIIVFQLFFFNLLSFNFKMLRS